jgi:hypothetical protein
MDLSPIPHQRERQQDQHYQHVESAMNHRKAHADLFIALFVAAMCSAFISVYVHTEIGAGGAVGGNIRAQVTTAELQGFQDGRQATSASKQ